MRTILVAFAVVLFACSTTPTLDAPTPSSTTSRFTPVPTTASPRRLPGSVVRVSVNGVENAADVAIRDPGPGPVTITLTFPFAVDRASVEQWAMSGQPTRTWLDDRTLRLVFAEAEPSIGFKIAETMSASGDTVIDFFVVSVPRNTHLVSVYTVADLAMAGRSAPRASGSWRVSASDGITLSPDAKRVLVFDGFSPFVGPPPTLVDLDTKQATILTQPSASDGWFSYADWMSDGRLVMVGRSVWVGAAIDATGRGMRPIADAAALIAGYPWVALPDPDGKRLAIWGYNSDGHIAVVDLTTGAAQRLTGPFRRCAADSATSFAWSADGQMLAGMDCDSEEGPFKARVRIVDVPSDRTVRTIEGGMYGISALADGTIMLVKDSGETGAGARLLGLVVGFDGKERARYLGGGWQMSPDRRYLLQRELSPAGCCGFTMLDLVSGSSFAFIVPSSGRSDGGPSSPHWLHDGRLAFF